MILTLDIMMKGGGERGMEILWISENLGPPLGDLLLQCDKTLTLFVKLFRSLEKYT